MISVVLLVVDFFLPSADGVGLIGEVAEWGILGISLVFLALAVTFRGRSF